MLAMVAMRASNRETEVHGKDGKQVWVRTPAGTTAAVQVQDDDTTEHLRLKVAKHLSIPPETSRLIFGGRHLPEKELLAEQGVEHGSTVHVVFRLRGGMDDGMQENTQMGEASCPGMEAAAGYIGEMSADFWSELATSTRAEIVANFTSRAKHAGQTQDSLWNLAIEAGAPAATDYTGAMRFLSAYEMFADVMIDFSLASWTKTLPPLIPEEIGAARERVQGSAGRDSEKDDKEDKKDAPTRKNLRRVKKRTGVPKWTIKLAKVITKLWGEEEEPPEAARMIWRVIIKLDANGRDHISKRAKEDKKKAKKKAKKDKKKKKKGKHSKKKKHSSSSSDSSSNSSSSSLSSSSSSSSSSDSDKKKKKKKKGKETYTSSGTKRQPEFKLMEGIKHFRDKAGNWIRCDKPPTTPCRICQGRHWWWEGAEHGCAGSR